MTAGLALVEDARSRFSVANGSALGLTLTNEEQERSVRSLSRDLERLGTSLSAVERFFRDYAEQGSVAAVLNLSGLSPWVSGESISATLQRLETWVDAADFPRALGRQRPCAVSIGPGCGGSNPHGEIASRREKYAVMTRLWISPLAVLYCAWFVVCLTRLWRDRLGSGSPPDPAPGRHNIALHRTAAR